MPTVEATSPAGISSVAKALGDPIRVRLVDAIRERGGEVCQCNLQPLVEVSQPTLSHHLGRLVDAGILSVERRGKWAWYSLQPDGLDGFRAWLPGGDD